MPDWRDQMDDPMAAQQVSDVVAFLVAQKPSTTGPAQIAPTQGTAKPRGGAR
jgi:hypothetical protein